MYLLVPCLPKFPVTMSTRKPWTRDELLQALYLYVSTPFGQQHSRHPPIVVLAEDLGRTPSSVAMKLNNFTSLDPVELARGVKGLSGASRADRALFEEYLRDPVGTLAQIESPLTMPPDEESETVAPSDTLALRRVRLTQDVFRRNVRVAYGHRCAVSGIELETLLRASHIKPWAASAERERTDPRNGILLAPFYDAAFDRGYITLEHNLRWRVSDALAAERSNVHIAHHLDMLHASHFDVPRELRPHEDFLEYHHQNVFRA